MKRVLIISILFYLYILNINAQSIKIYSDCNSYSKPLLLKYNDTAIIKCDSVYVINLTRYKLYEKSVSLIKSIDYSNVNLLINSYNNEISLYKLWNDSLQKKYNNISLLYNNTLNNTQNSLVLIKKDVTTATDSLISANNNINNALKHLNIAKWEKYKYLGIGIISGTLTTLLIVTYKK